MAEYMMELQDVEKSFPGPGGGIVRILKGTSLRLKAGEAAGLAGSSGSGKTTLINIAAGLLAPDSGKVLLGGTDLYSLSEAGRDRFRAGNIGYIFQNFQLIPSLSAWENVMAALYFGRIVPRGERRERCRTLLEQVGLSDRLGHRPDQLSGGEQQRVCIARALANKPPVLLADEPTANLDAQNRRQVTKLLLEACRLQGVSLLAATHDQGLLKALPRTIWLEGKEAEEYAV